MMMSMPLCKCQGNLWVFVLLHGETRKHAVSLVYQIFGHKEGSATNVESITVSIHVLVALISPESCFYGK